MITWSLDWQYLLKAPTVHKSSYLEVTQDFLEITILIPLTETYLEVILLTAKEFLEVTHLIYGHKSSVLEVT